MKNKLLIIFLLFSIFGCRSVTPYTQLKTYNSSEPEKNIVYNVLENNTIITLKSYETSLAVRITKNNPEQGVTKGVYYAKGLKHGIEKGSTVYLFDGDGILPSSHGGGLFDTWLEYDNVTKILTRRDIYIGTLNKVTDFKIEEDAILSPCTTKIITFNSIDKEKIFFTYKEIIDNEVNKTETFYHNLNDSNIIEYEEIRFKILSFNNNSLTYVIID